MPILWLEVDDLAATAQWLRDRDIDVDAADEDGTFLMVRDPDGLVIEIWPREKDEDA